MKKLLIVCLIFTLIACKEEPKVDYAIISGKIINKEKGDVSILNYDRSFEEVLSISNTGTFVDTIQIKESTYILYDGKNPVFLHLEPGFNLNISYDAKDFEKSILISGKGSETNTYLIEKSKIEKELFGSPQETYSLGEDEFKNKLQEITEAQNKLLTESKGISNAYKEKEKRELKYFQLNVMKDFEAAHKYFTKNENFKVSDNFFNEMNGFDYNNEADFESSNNYKSILRNHYLEEAENLAKEDSMRRDLAFIKTVGGIEIETIKNGLLYDYANSNMNYSKDVDAFYDMFMVNSSDETKNKLITEKYNKLQALNVGKASPKFVNYENYKGGTTSLDDLKGKYVYIDVWATWCGPCIAEIPSLKKIEKQFHDKNIEFVSISIDKASDHQKWKTMVEEKELGGIQLFADNDWKSGFVTDYQINGIPRFILIDPEGNIVNSNAPRPSNPRLVQLFAELSI